jgi:hypothetical protein
MSSVARVPGEINYWKWPVRSLKRPCFAKASQGMPSEALAKEGGADERNRTSDPVLTKDVLYP